MIGMSKFATRLALLHRTPRSLVRFCSNQPQKPLQQESQQPLSKKDQLKRAVSQYGSTVIVFHVTISLASLGFFYILVSSGVDVVSLVEKAPIVGETLKNSSIATGASTFALSYAIHKVFAPVRISITLGSVPFIVKYLRARGILKAPK